VHYWVLYNVRNIYVIQTYCGLKPAYSEIDLAILLFRLFALHLHCINPPTDQHSLSKTSGWLSK